jgi:monoamine oxidase
VTTKSGIVRWKASALANSNSVNSFLASQLWVDGLRSGIVSGPSSQAKKQITSAALAQRLRRSSVLLGLLGSGPEFTGPQFKALGKGNDRRQESRSLNEPLSDLRVETVVIGAGVSGLAAALLLTKAGVSVRVIEARDTPGGRIRSVVDPTSGAFLADLGPTWVWPIAQPVVRRWAETLGLETFPQFRAGSAVLDHGPGTKPEVLFLPSQTDNERVVGGSQAIVDQLVAGLPRDTILCGSPVTSVSIDADGVELRVGDEPGSTLRCERVVVAVPPRIALHTIRWTPAFSPALADALDGMPTWMAPHAKVAVLYDEPFWREQGLSGRIASRSGPIVEGHDHSGPDGVPAALCGFIGWPHDLRAKLGSKLEAEVHAQLARCFGPESPEPRSIHIEDWAANPRVASPHDLSGPMEHPEVGPEILRHPHAQGRLYFASAETALRSPGLIEGAFDAAERAAAGVQKARRE